MRRLAVSAVVAVCVVAGACGPVASGDPPPSPFAVDVVRFEVGENGGFGADRMPGVVLGPPHGGATEAEASTDVVSLGLGGAIVVELGEEIVDGAGDDLIVFENPFKIATTGTVFTEPGEVSVSEDGDALVAFPCDSTAPAPNGCAGFGVVRASADKDNGNDIDPTDAARAGGDDFDLATIGVARARVVRIVDKSTAGAAPKAGFDLDAVAVARH